MSDACTSRLFVACPHGATEGGTDGRGSMGCAPSLARGVYARPDGREGVIFVRAVVSLLQLSSDGRRKRRRVAEETFASLYRPLVAVAARAGRCYGGDHDSVSEAVSRLGEGLARDWLPRFVERTRDGSRSRRSLAEYVTLRLRVHFRARRVTARRRALATLGLDRTAWVVDEARSGQDAEAPRWCFACGHVAEPHEAMSLDEAVSNMASRVVARFVKDVAGRRARGNAHRTDDLVRLDHESRVILWGRLYGCEQRDLARILGTSEATIARRVQLIERALRPNVAEREIETLYPAALTGVGGAQG